MKALLLALLFVLALFAEESEEIGKPTSTSQEVPAKIEDIISAAFSNDGNNLYVLQGGFITIYQTNPMKMIDSFYIGATEDHHPHPRIYVTQDKKGIVYHDRGFAELWDIASKKLIKRLPFAISSAVSTIKGFAVVSRENSKVYLLDEKTFEVIRHSKYAYKYDYEASHAYTESVNGMLANNNILLLTFNSCIMLVDLNTLEKLEHFDISIHSSEYSQKISDISGVKPSNSYTLNHLFVLQPSNPKNESAFGFKLFRFSKKGSMYFRKYFYKNPDKEGKYILYQDQNKAWMIEKIGSPFFSGSDNLRQYHKIWTMPDDEAKFDKHYKPQYYLKD